VKDHLSSVIRGGTATIPLQRRPTVTLSEEQCKEIAALAAAAQAGGAEAVVDDSGGTYARTHRYIVSIV
jgi:hypothetical protein